MNPSDEANRKFVVEIRVRGESDEDLRGHDWYYFQLWDASQMARVLGAGMRKNAQEIEQLLRNYERFEVEMAVRPESLVEAEVSEADDALADLA